MPTRLYLHNDAASNFVAGTLPSGEQSAATADDAIAASLKSLSGIKSTRSITFVAALNSIASASSKKYFFLAFCSLPLASAQSVGAASISISLSGYEESLNANFKLNSMHIYIWRPSTGAKVGTIIDQPNTGAVTGAAEPSTAFGYSVMQSTLSSGLSTVAAQAGDVIIFEAWAKITQSSATSYALGMSYDGKTEDTTNGASIGATHASFIQFSEALTFWAGVQSGITGMGGSATMSMVGSRVLSSDLSAAGAMAASFVSIPVSAGALEASGEGAASFEGGAIVEAVASMGGSGAMSAMSGTPPIHTAEFMAAATLTMTVVGRRHFPHKFEQEDAGPDGWVKEAGL